MHYIAFLILWLPRPIDKPPVAAFLAHFDTMAACEEKLSQVDLPEETKNSMKCVLLVVEPKLGIKE